MAQFDLTTSLANAAFNAEKKRRKYDPVTGQYVDPKTGVASPDVQPYERPGFLARTFSPEAQELLAYNKQWIDKPREAKMGRNIELDRANENFAAMTPKEQEALVSAQRAKSIFGADGTWNADTLMAHEEGMAKVLGNNAEVLAESERLRGLADTQADRNRLVSEKYSSLLGMPLSDVDTKMSGNRWKQTLANTERTLLPVRAGVEQQRLADESEELLTVSPYKRQDALERMALDKQRRDQVERPDIANQIRVVGEVRPAEISNQIKQAENEKGRLLGVGERQPFENAAALDEAKVKATIAAIDQAQGGLLADTRRDINIGNRAKAQFMGKDPAEAMTQALYSNIGEGGDVNMRAGLYDKEGYAQENDLLAANQTAPQTRFSANGQALPTPPAFLSRPLGSAGVSTPLGGIPSRGVSMGAPVAPETPPAGPVVAPEQPLGMQVAPPNSPNTTPLVNDQGQTWTVNDMVRAQANQGVRQLAPQEKAAVDAMHQEFRGLMKSIPEGSMGKKIINQVMSEAAMDELGIPMDFIGDSNLTGSPSKTFQRAIKDPMVKARLDNLQPHQVARIYEKVKQALIEGGIIKNDKPELLAPLQPVSNPNSPWLTERYGLTNNYAPR